MNGRLGAGLALLVLLLPPAALPGATFVVTKTADTGDGACGADCSLREAVAAANATPGPDQITVPAGDYLLELGELELEDDVEVVGAGADVTTLDAAYASPLVRVQDGVAAGLSGLTLTGGQGSYSDPVGGGAISNLGDLTVTGSTIRYNSGRMAGAIASEGSLTIVDSTVQSNYANDDGAAGGIRSFGSLTLANTTVSDNYAFAFYGAGGIRADTAVVDASTISDNDSFYFAGGIDADHLTLTNSTVSGNRASEFTGGIAAFRTLVVESSVIRDNENAYYYDGGGIFTGGTGEIVDTLVTGNFSGFAGGIKNTGELTLRNSTVTGNEAAYAGGVANGRRYGRGPHAFCEDCVLVVEGSTVSGNTSRYGGAGGMLNRGIATLTNTTISGNGAFEPDWYFGGGVSRGGGILNSGVLTLVHTTITDNEAPVAGAVGNVLALEPCPACEVEVASSILAANPSTDGGAGCVGPIDTLGHNIVDDPSCGFGAPGDQLVPDASLSPLQDNGGPSHTHALLDGSPAIDAIPVASCVDAVGDPVLVDQRGASRPGGVACDAGAYERAPDTLAVAIDIAPRNDRNLLGPLRVGFVHVALLGSADFDVRDVDTDTLAFGPDGAEPLGWRAARQRDVDRDGFTDLVSSYRKQETGIALGDPEACLTGETLGGTPFEGCDAIQTVPPRCGFGFLQAAWVLPAAILFRRRQALAA